MNKMKNLTVESAKNYINDFLPTLSNFCSKSPLNISIKYVDDLNKIFLSYDDKIMEVSIDINKNKKEVIKEIKNDLYKDYPIIYEKMTKVPDSKEVEKLINNGVSLSEALNTITIDYVPKYKIMRKHDKFNEVDLLELKTNSLYKFKSKIPVTVLLNLCKYKDESVLDNLTVLYKIENKSK